MKLSLVIPAYNEAEGVSHTVEHLKPVLDDLRTGHTLDVIFVDDGSRDQTANLLKHAFAGDADVKVVSHEHNRGMGAAIRTGFRYAAGDVIVTTDFDGTYAFETIPALIQRMIDSGADIVTASPYHPDGDVEGVPRYRLLFSFGASMFYRLLVKWRIHTWTALYRAYRRTVIKSVSFKSDGFLANTELLVNALDAGFTVSEYPTVLQRRKFGQSSIKVARVTMTHLKYIRTLVWRKRPARQPRSV